jgi:hypothetical protein
LHYAIKNPAKGTTPLKNIFPGTYHAAARAVKKAVFHGTAAMK